MRYHFTDQPIASASQSLAATLKDQLDRDKKVLWLLSGGSSLEIASLVAKQLGQVSNLDNLAITMTDERYGPVGHADENWQLLLNAGFEIAGADLYRPLIGKPRDKTAAALAAWLDAKLESTDYKIGIFGVGTDGHTAGIKPDSPAVSSAELVSEFKGDDFERITITPNLIRQLDEAIVQISGTEKADQLHSLLKTSQNLKDQPAQILKTIPNTTIYTDILIDY